MTGKWMGSAVKNPGYLHRALGVPEGEKIPTSKVEAATHSSNPHMRKAANLAQTFAHFHPTHKHAHKQGVPGQKKAHHAS